MKETKHVRKFFEENSGKLFAYMVKMAGNKDDAEDCFQECFIRYTEKYPDRFSLPLLFTVAKSICIDSFRRNKRYESSDDEYESPSQSPEDALISKDINRALAKAMDMLDKQERELLAMAGPKGFSYREISDITGLTQANIKVKIHRTRQKLKSLLGDVTNA